MVAARATGLHRGQICMKRGGFDPPAFRIERDRDVEIIQPGNEGTGRCLDRNIDVRLRAIQNQPRAICLCRHWESQNGRREQASAGGAKNRHL